MIILDTHTWIWWASESPSLSDTAAQAIEKADRLGVVVITCWEVAMLVAKNRLGLNKDIDEWIETALQLPKIKLLPITPKRCGACHPPAWRVPRRPC